MILLVPSRGRPERAAIMCASARETAEGPIEILVMVDPDDPALEGYRELVPDVVVLPERLGYSGSLNHGARLSWDEHAILGAFGDDVIFRTKGWDRLVARALRIPGLCYPNDLAHRAGWATAVWMSAQVAQALGWLAYPGCWHQYVDNVWWEIGHAIGRLTYLEGVVVEHMHQAYGKAEMDDTYRSVYSMPQAGIDHQAFLDWKATGMADDVERVKVAL